MCVLHTTVSVEFKCNFIPQVTLADVTAAENHGLDLIKKTGAYFVNQFHNDNNSLSHAKTTGPEIWKQTGGKIDAFLATVPPVFSLMLSKVNTFLQCNLFVRLERQERSWG